MPRQRCRPRPRWNGNSSQSAPSLVSAARQRNLRTDPGARMRRRPHRHARLRGKAGERPSLPHSRSAGFLMRSIPLQTSAGFATGGGDQKRSANREALGDDGPSILAHKQRPKTVTEWPQVGDLDVTAVARLSPAECRRDRNAGFLAGPRVVEAQRSVPRTSRAVAE